MLSWIFRHRLRLSAIYGMVQAPALPQARKWAKELTGNDKALQRPGHLIRRGKHVELRPMPPRVRDVG